MKDGEARPVLNGIRQWVRVAGGEHRTLPLVALHGGPGGNHYVFERSIGPLLEKQRTVIYHEQRGCGRSDPPLSPTEYSLPLLVADLNALLDWLNVPQVDLLGYSFGGGLALEFALAHPERVRRLVLQAPALSLNDPHVVESQLSGFQAVTKGELRGRIESILAEPSSASQKLEAVWAIVDSATVDRFLFEQPEKAARNRQLWQASGLVNTGEMTRALRAQPSTSTARCLNEIRQPALILAGRHDRNVPLGMLEEMSRKLPQACLQIFENSAHFPDIEETEAYAQAVLSFLS